MRRLSLPLILGLGGAVILVTLGVWQVQRLAWKEAVISRIEAQVAGPPVALPAAPDPETDRYRPVAIEGEYLPGEIGVFTGDQRLGAGFRIIAPFQTTDGRRILVDRGFVRQEERGVPRPGGKAQITGNLHWPAESDSFTPAPDPATFTWYARDVPAMAEALATEPVLVVLRSTSQTDTPVTPMPVDAAGIPNNHLQYAITWFALAAVWLAMTAYFIRRPPRRKD